MTNATTSSLQFLHSGADSTCTAVLDKRFVGYWSLQFMDRGRLWLAYDDTVHELDGCWVWFCWPGPRIRFHALTSTWSHRYVAFAGPGIVDLQGDNLLLQRPQFIRNVHMIRDLFDALLEQWQARRTWDLARAHNTFERLLIEIASERAEVSGKDEWFASLVVILAETNYQTPDYEEVSHRLGMSLSSLRKRFLLTTGVTLHQHVIQRRIALTRDALLKTNATLEVVADDLGYSDVYYLSKLFKRHTGLTPNQFRKSSNWIVKPPAS